MSTGLSAAPEPLPFPVPPTAATATVEPAPGTPAWCPTTPNHRVECGTVTRPLVDGKPDLGSIDVGYALVRRTDESRPAENTILVNPGGPGSQAVALIGVYTSLLGPLTIDHDMLLIDPRGVGVSTPVSCGVGVKEMHLGTRADMRRAMADCADALGPKAEGYTTAATADDFNAVRQKLGLGKLSLVGHSYGTYLMPVYAERHPDTVTSMVLSAAYPVDFDSLGRPSAEAVRDTFRRICARSRACDGERVLRDLRRVAAKLRVKPLGLRLTVDGQPQSVELNESRLVSLIYSHASGGVGAFPDETPLIGTLPAAIHQAARGDTTRLVEVVTGAFQQFVDVSAGADHGLGIAVMCNDYPRLWSVDAPQPQRWRQFARGMAQAEPSEFHPFSREGFVYGQLDGAEVCIEWPKNGTARPYVSTGDLPDVPTLVLSGDLDGNTSERNGRLAAAQFRNADYVTVPNAGHVPDQEATGCASGIVAHFVREERVGDTSCLKAIPPVKVDPVAR
ncbi:alpha/beta fold hydrolase [Sinosporangium album]|uniref:alpha/beta fold hydrolase n=1 Tax=Sinosporangium album TaxID=504805 RepID=UPI00115FE1C6|nr:alpha/beta fold hydrolase [Sinosporangium album]